MANSRLDLVRRQNAGKAQRDHYVEEIQGLGVPEQYASLLSLEESDAVRDRSNEAFLARNAPNSGVVQRKIPFGQLDRIGDLIPTSDGDVFVIPWNANLVGLLKWPASVLNRFWKELIRLQPDGIIVIDSAFSSKLVAQVVEDFGAKEVDFAAWGEAWRTHLSEAPFS